MTPQEKIEELKQKYKRELPDKFRAIEELFQKYETKGFDQESFNKFYRMVHNLVGSSATFGLMNVSQKARALEEMLKPYIIGHSTPSEKNNLKIKIQLGALARVCIAKNLHKEIAVNQIASEAAKEDAFAINSVIYLLLNKGEKYYSQLDKDLHDFGFDVSIFYDDAELLSAMEKKLPALLIVDYDFFAIEEFASNLALLHQEQRNNFIIFTLSKSEDFITRLKSVQSGSDWLFTKPCTADKIIEKFDVFWHHESTEPLKVLILDDEIDVANYYASILEDAGIDTKCIEQPHKILDVMAEYKPDLLITDLYMDGCSGEDVAKILRQFDEYIPIPIIFLSVEDNEMVQNRALGSVAEEFISKPIKALSFVTRVKNKIRRYRSMREQIEKDSLTNLYNHVTVLNFLNKSIEAAKRYNYPLSFVMLDIDLFKKVNDTYGHQVGDSVLKSLASLLKHRVRESDIVGRYGGEEFAVILPYTTLSDAVKIIEELREKFANIIQSDGEQQFHVSFSAGVCQFIEGMSIAELIENADEALYKAKQNGRNQTVSCQ